LKIEFSGGSLVFVNPENSIGFEPRPAWDFTFSH